MRLVSAFSAVRFELKMHRTFCKEHKEQGGSILDKPGIKIESGGVGVDSSPKFHWFNRSVLGSYQTSQKLVNAILLGQNKRNLISSTFQKETHFVLLDVNFTLCVDSKVFPSWIPLKC